MNSFYFILLSFENWIEGTNKVVAGPRYYDNFLYYGQKNCGPKGVHYNGSWLFFVQQYIENLSLKLGTGHRDQILVLAYRFLWQKWEVHTKRLVSGTFCRNIARDLSPQSFIKYMSNLCTVLLGLHFWWLWQNSQSCWHTVSHEAGQLADSASESLPDQWGTLQLHPPL